MRRTLTFAIAAAMSLSILTPLAAQAGSSEAPPVSVAPPTSATDRIVVRWEPGTSPAERQAAQTAASEEHQVELEKAATVGVGTDVVRVREDQDVMAVAEELASQPGVLSAKPARLHPMGAPDDLDYNRQWNLGPSGTNVTPAWPPTQSAGQVVAVIDSGITAHPELDSKRVPGYDFITDTSISRDGGGPDADPTDHGDWTTSQRHRALHDWSGMPDGSLECCALSEGANR